MRGLFRKKKRRSFTALLLAVLCLAGCGGQEREQVVELTLPQRSEQAASGSGLTVTNIYTYDYEIQLTKEQQVQLENVMIYDDMVVTGNEYYKSKGIAQAGFDGEDVYLVSQEGDAVVTRVLNMEYGFYEKTLEDAAVTWEQGRIWTSPDGSKRLLKVFDEAEGCWCLDWQEKGGFHSRVMADNERMLDMGYELQCVWSADSSRVFIRLCPRALFPEYGTEDQEGEGVSDAAGNYVVKDENNEYMISIRDISEIWMLSGEGEELSASFVGSYGLEKDGWLPRMIVSEDGRAIYLTINIVDWSRMTELDMAINDGTIYLEEGDDGNWSGEWNGNFSEYGLFRTMELQAGVLRTLTRENRIGLWNLESMEYAYQGGVLEYTVLKVISFHQTTLDQDFTYGVSGNDIYRMEYDEQNSRWNMELIYKGPSEAQFLDIAAQPETGNLLIHYILLSEWGDTREMELVLLTF